MARSRPSSPCALLLALFSHALALAPGPGKLILLRHGQSSWNLENRFTGWEDVPLTPKGELEAREATELLLAEVDAIDACYTSVLQRAISTANICLEGWTANGQRPMPPMRPRWRLNERHYGALQGLDKSEAMRKMSGSDLHEWRLSFNGAPPPMAADHPF